MTPEEAARLVVPRVTTPRLVLRAFETKDFDAFAENFGDPLATEHLGGPIDRRAAWRSFGSGLGFWLLQGAGWWGVELEASGEMVGTVGAFYREGEGFPDLELGWTVYRRHWGNGYATEAATAALAFGIERHGVKRVIAHIAAGNPASIGVSRKLGMQPEGEVPFYDIVSNRYAITRSQ